MVGQEAEEEPLHVLQGGEVAALPAVGGVHRCTGGWHRYAVPAAGTLLHLRTHRHEPAAARLFGSQQPTGIHCRILRQLRLLPQRPLAALPAVAHHQHRHAGHPGGIGMAQRAHLLQHRLSCRHGAVVLQPLLMAEDSFRQREVPQLFALHQELQERLHRLQDAYRGL